MVLDNDATKDYLDSCSVKKFSKGDVILYQGEVPRWAYVVKEGTVKLYNITSGGEQQIIGFVTVGEFFPTPWIFKKTPGTIYYYEALTNCKLLRGDRDSLMAALMKDKQTMADLIDYYVNGYVGSLMRITALEQSKASEKIIHTLFYLIERYGKEILTGVYRIKIDLTHQTIADLVGLTRETTATELSILKKKNIVSYKRQRYLVKKPALMELIGEDNFKDLKF